MGFFSDLLVRSNGQEILYSWFNSIRTAGIGVESFLGTSYLTPGTAVISNNVTDQDVTGLAFDKDQVTSAVIYAEVRRKADTFEYVTSGYLKVHYLEDSADWEIVDELSGGSDDGVSFSITSAGQVQYTSTNEDPTNYVGAIKFKAHTL